MIGPARDQACNRRDPVTVSVLACFHVEHGFSACKHHFRLYYA